MSNLSKSILTYSGGDKEGLTEYMESAKNDFLSVLKFLAILCIGFIVVIVGMWCAFCIGLYNPNEPMVFADVVTTLTMSACIFLGGLLVGAYQHSEIEKECKKQIEKIEYMEEINRKE